MRTAHKLALSIFMFIGSFPMLMVSGWFGVGIPIGLVFSILYWFDLGRELRHAPPDKGWQRVLGLLMGVPQAIFGFLCLSCGIAIIVWILYNSFWATDPRYSGGFLTFGVAPLFVLFGAGLLVDAFRRSKPNVA